jgi:uncharacterized radical SAM superfamily protein
MTLAHVLGVGHRGMLQYSRLDRCCVPRGTRGVAMSAGARRLENVRISKLEREIEAIKDKLSKLGAITVPIQTLAPEDLEVIKEIPVVVQRMDDDYIASFFDANINASGDTDAEAVTNLKDILVTVFNHLDTLPPAKLGPRPRRQLAVLRDFIRRRA